MKPYLYTVSDNVHRGPFSEGCKVEPPRNPPVIDTRKWGHAGYIFSPGGIVTTIYQRGGNYWWCASTWCSPLPKRIMTTGGVFYTTILFSNLNFTNTAFEHRYNLIDPANNSAEACRLAVEEGLLWDWDYNGFVPFIHPYPHGYQGVYGVFGNRLPNARQVRPTTESQLPHPEYEIYRVSVDTLIGVSAQFDVDPSVLKC